MSKLVYHDSLLGKIPEHELAKRTKKTIWFLRKRRKELGISPYQKVVNHNSKYFDVITAESSYWLGYYFADGCIYKNGTRHHALLGSIDREVVKKLQSAIKFPNSSISRKKLNNDNTYYSVCINSKRLICKLEELGCVPNKTFIIGPPNIKKEFYWSFLMGFFDGDGSISVNSSINSWKASFGTASKKFYLWARKLFDKEKMNYSVEVRQVKNGAFYIICFCGWDAKIFLEKMYNSTPNKLPMTRKLEKFKKLCKSVKQRNRNRDRINQCFRK